MTRLHHGVEEGERASTSMADPAIRTAYDEVPYPSYPLPQSHPDHLATLLALSPPTTERCRVLELGCASGGNVIPMALTLPDSQFVGIDLSREQIAEGQKTVEALGLTNIDLRHLSILDIDDSFGSFDYIVCHGVYSWVPDNVQDRILTICARHLVPEGIGYVSYNTYPVWHMRGTIRDMMCHHIGRFAGEPPVRQVERARALLEFLARSTPAENSPYGLMLRQHVDLLRQHSDSYLFHEFLEENNQPVYFLQFCERLAAHGLRYLAEAEFHSMLEYDGLDSEPDSCRRCFPFFDQVGAAVLVEDELGHRVWSARIDPYGMAHVDPSSRIDVPLRFPGHYADPEIGLYYNRFRFYSPELGRYTQSDPVDIGAGLNVYAYPANPLAQADVRGECPPGDPPKGKGEEEDKAGQLQTGKPGVVHRVGGGDEKNLGLKPAEAKLNPPGISVLIGGTPADTAAAFRRVFGPKSSLGKLASTVGTAEIEQIRKAGFDVIPVPTKNFPNHGRIIHPTQGAAGFTPENLQKLSPVFTNTTGL